MMKRHMAYCVCQDYTSNSYLCAADMSGLENKTLQICSEKNLKNLFEKNFFVNFFLWRQIVLVHNNLGV